MNPTSIESLIIDLTAALRENTAALLGQTAEAPTQEPVKRGRKKKEVPAEEHAVEESTESVAEVPVEEPAEESAVEEVVAEQPATDITHESIKELVRQYRKENQDKVHINTADLAKVCADLGIKNISACPDSKLAVLHARVVEICQ